MRRPVLGRWAKKVAMEHAGASSFDLRALSAKAQREHDEVLAAALLLFATESDRIDRLMSFVWDDDLRTEYENVLAKLSGRSAEKLALRGTPMMSMPPAYRKLMEDYAAAYQAPERIEEEKRRLWEQTRNLQIRKGISPMKVARALKLDPPNTSAYLKNGSVEKFTLDTVRDIYDYVSNA
jgi:hypothetical protein